MNRNAHRIGIAMLAAVLVTACNRNYPSLTPEQVGAKPLTGLNLESAEVSIAVKAAIARLKESGENPSDFYIGPIETRSDGTMELPLWFKTLFFEKQITIGDPSGKSRTMLFDPKQGKIVSDLVWQ